MKRLTQSVAPTLVNTFGVGPDTAATLLIAAGSNPDRLRSKSAFASMCGVTRYRLHQARRTDIVSTVEVTARPTPLFIESS